MATIPDFSQSIILALLGLGFAAHSPPDAGPDLAISGKATSTATATVFYAFTPKIYQNGFRNLRFTVQNKPSWASFGSRHGTLFGVPKAADAGAYPNIIITVSDGETTVDLPAFAIKVVGATIAVAH